jgi:CRISPR-associated helicase Cas3/CRISPR-associated endonuclease Cas3-HD
MSSTYYAHSANDAGAWHLLREHLTSVAQLAGQFAGAAPWRAEAEFAGEQHDVGKFGDRFQARLRGEDAGLDHWSQGAWLALSGTCGGPNAIAAALAIEGHHIGLQPATPDMARRLNPKHIGSNHPLRLDLSHPDPQRVLARAHADGLTFSAPAAAMPVLGGPAVARMLNVRLLFSCLVDADFLDTEAHFNGDAHGKRPRKPGPALEPAAAIRALDAYMQRLGAGKPADPAVAKARRSLWEALTAAAGQNVGLFTATAPTGSGKTLATLKFALEHAARHSLKRIIIAVPFLTVIEQTAAVYRAVFADAPEHYVLEHHSLAGLGRERIATDAVEPAERQRRLLAENWDAPIVLTTNVQLLESLFSNRPSACRKLHNLMESVIIFDEAQGLPRDLAVATLAALSHLSATYRSTVVFATATQPAFATLHNAVKSFAPSGWQPREAVPENLALFESLRRVEVQWPAAQEKRDWDDLARELDDAPRALCIVNLKRHARALLDALRHQDGIRHLSTNLCPEHRRDVVARLREDLKHGRNCRLVSTQCIEAGVDVDFPLVYRAMAPLDAIAQATGRCNREGRLPGLGRVVVFDPADDVETRRLYPTPAYYQATEVTRTMPRDEGNLDIGSTELFTRYYRRLYDLTHPETENKRLNEAITGRDFPEIARLYRLIDQDAIQVLVPWSERLDEFEELRRQAIEDGIDGRWMRRAQGLAVNLYRPARGQAAWEACLIPARQKRGGESRDWRVLEESTGARYDDTLGLILPDGEQVYIA